MDQGPLVNEQFEAGARFLAEYQKIFPVQSAFWVRDPEREEVWLYVVVEGKFDIRKAYREVGRISDEIDEPWFDEFRVKIIGTDKEIAKAVRELPDRLRGRIPPRFYQSNPPFMTTAELYVYPVPITVPE